MTSILIKRFNVIDRLFHLSLMLTFMIQAATGFARLYTPTPIGERLTHALGGSEVCLLIHKSVGTVMIIGFLIHTFYLLSRVDWKNPLKCILGPDSLAPNPQDLRHLKQRVLWSLGLSPEPRFDRWTYYEKFDYWAVYWGLPLLGITGLMVMFPFATCAFLPGWSLNIAILLHKAEAILAVTYIFVVHFFIGHLRPRSFPMNEAMFSGAAPIEEVIEEKPAWMARIKAQKETGRFNAAAPAALYRVIYFIFGFSVLAAGIYLLVNGIIYSRGINLH